MNDKEYMEWLALKSDNESLVNLLDRMTKDNIALEGMLKEANAKLKRFNFYFNVFVRNIKEDIQEDFIHK